MYRDRLDEFCARVGIRANSKFSDKFGISYSRENNGDMSVQLSISFTAHVRVSQDAMMFDTRGIDTAVILGDDLAMRMKEELTRFVSEVCLKAEL